MSYLSKRYKHTSAAWKWKQAQPPTYIVFIRVVTQHKGQIHFTRLCRQTFIRLGNPFIDYVKVGQE